MPSRNVVKTYADEHFYHVYNRGVEKRDIFLDGLDYGVFLNRLKTALTPLKPDDDETVRRNNHVANVELIAYCLMPNHYHLVIRQKAAPGVTAFMRTIATSYSMYFNARYERVGSLFQGIYKAAEVNSEEYLMHLSRYIHLNPVSLKQDFAHYPYSSYKFFNDRSPQWLQPEPVLELFKSASAYRDFVHEAPHDSADVLGDITLE